MTSSVTGLRVLAAMSGGVDSAVAAARAVAAGHEVTGVHLALSANPRSYRSGARGCCTLEDARDARRAADVIGIPFYVWDMAERFAADVVDDFVAEYARGNTPNPCLRCNEKIKFAAVLDRAVALGFDAVCTGHHARLEPDGPGLPPRLLRSVDLAKDQSYVLAVLTGDQLSRAMFPLGDSTKAQVRAEAAERGLAVADKPDSHDVCFIADGDTRGFLRRRLGAAPGAIVDDGRRGDRQPSGQLRLHRRTAAWPAHRQPGARRQAAVRARHRACHQHRAGRPGRGTRRRRDHRRPAGLERLCAALRPVEATVQLRAHGETFPATCWPEGGSLRDRAARQGPRRREGPGGRPVRRRRRPRLGDDRRDGPERASARTEPAVRRGFGPDPAAGAWLVSG